jgi:hypothetical protein
MGKRETARPPAARALVSERRAAIDLLDFSPSYLRQLRTRGVGPAYYRFGKAVRYRPEDCQRWAEDHRVEPVRRRA